MNIIITGGGTLGHIIPAKLLLEEIIKTKKDINIFYVGKKNSMEEELISHYADIVFVCEDLTGFSKNIFQCLKSLLKFYRSYKNMKIFIKEKNIKLVIGAGGNVTSSTLYAAYKLNIKTVIHEQNAVLGITNNIMKNKVDLLITSFESDKIKLKRNHVKCLGNPSMDNCNDVRKKGINNSSSSNIKTILITGGSLGAQKINECAICLFEIFKNRREIAFILVTGKKYYSQYEKYNYLYNNVRVIDRSEQFIHIANQASIVITRAGATTLSEIIGLRKLSIIIPSPNVSKNHQEYNANIIKDLNAGIVILEKDLTVCDLQSNIERLLKDENLKKGIIQKLEFINKENVCQNIVKEAFNLIKESD